MRRRLIYLAVILSCVLIIEVRAQETGQPVAPLNGEYIREWLVIGPFFPDDLDKDFLVDVGDSAS